MIKQLRLLAGAALLALAPSSLAGEPTVKLPAYKKTVLTNGLTVLLMEQPKVPLVSLQFTLRSGSTRDPKGKEGLASLTANLLRKGTATRTSDQVAEALDSVGASFGAFAGVDSLGCTAEFMKKDAAKGIELLADLLQNPVFPEAEVIKLRTQRIDGLRAAKDSAQGVIRNYYQAFLFGEHPYGRSQNGDERSLATLTREDVVAFHKTAFTPSNAILAIVGDFRTPDMERLVKERFGAWHGPKAAATPLAQPKAVQGRKLLLVDKPDATQTYFMVGNLGVARNNPDRVGIQVVNVLFGERFTSMINTALRIKTGLTYGANASFSMLQVPGSFAISSFTANATTEKALDLTLATLQELHAKGITEEDLASAKAYIKGTLPPKTLETGQQLAAVLSDLQRYGLPDDEVNGFFAKVDALTLAEARRIIRDYYPDQNLCFVLIGKASEIKPTAEKLAPVCVTRSITDPGF